MSTHGKATRYLLEASVSIERSFEDYGYPPSVVDQVNEPTLKIRINRLQLDITRRLKPGKTKISRLDNRSYYGWFGRYFVDLYVEAQWREDPDPYYLTDGSGDWTEHHGNLVDNDYRGE